MRQGRHSAWFKPLVSLVIAGTITLASAAGLAADVFFGTQLRLSDALFPGVQADDRIVVVAIDYESVARVGRWPWSRAEHAKLVDAMAADGATLIGYDVTFGSPSEDDPAGDQALSTSIEAAGSVVLSETATFEGTPTDSSGDRAVPAGRGVAAGRCGRARERSPTPTASSAPCRR
jgi:CHASE2 domain-containing sensor protein